MIVLGIDPGTTCGWAMRTENMMQSSTWDLTARRHEGGGMRFLRLRSYLKTMLDMGTVGALFYEEVRMHMGVDAAHVYGGVIAVISEECESRKIPYGGIHYAQVKKLATGKGNASKEMMLEAAHVKWPDFTGTSFDEADARWIAEAGWESLRS